MPSQIVTFDGIDVSEWFSTWQETSNARLNLVGVPRRHGALISDSIVQDARQITIEGRIQAITDLQARIELEYLSALFARQNVPLRLWDDRFINVYKASFAYEYAQGGGLATIDFTITFFCPDPFYYYGTEAGGSLVLPNLTMSDTLLDYTNDLYRKAPFDITVEGNFIAYPVWTIIATAYNPLHFITVRNLTTGRQFTYTGTVLSGKALVVDTANFTVQNDGVDDLTHWSGDFVWFDPAEDNSIQFEGTAPAAYSWSYTARTY